MSDTERRAARRPLTEEERGGHLIEFPDLPGCMPAARAKRERVSFNTLAVTLLAEGLGERTAHGD
jgi:hypothetical protein